MDNEAMIRELQKYEDKYKDKFCGFGELNISAMCGDVKLRLKDLNDEIVNLKAKNAQLRKEMNTNTVIHCSDCDHYRAKTITDGEPHNYVCCRTNGYSPSEKHYCAWAEQSVIPMRWRYTAACTARYVEGETINGVQSETEREETRCVVIVVK